MLLLWLLWRPLLCWLVLVVPIGCVILRWWLLLRTLAFWLVLSVPACSWCLVERLLVSRAVLCTSCAVHFSWDSLSSLSSVGSDQESGRECTAHAVHCLTLAISPWWRLLLSFAWFSFVSCCSTFLVLFQVPFNCTWFFDAPVLGCGLDLVPLWCRVMMNSVPASAVSLSVRLSCFCGSGLPPGCFWYLERNVVAGLPLCCWMFVIVELSVGSMLSAAVGTMWVGGSLV